MQRTTQRYALMAWILLGLLGCWSAAQAATRELTRIIVTVADLDRTETYYREGLGFTTVERREIDDPAYAQLIGVPDAKIRSLRMRLGREEVEFQQFAQPGETYPADSRSPDAWFQHFAIIVSDMPQAYAHLRRQVPLTPISEDGPQTLPPENGRVQAYKFRDPDGHPLELLYFPPGVGRPLWAEAARVAKPGQWFLGIDHSAIGVSDTRQSRAFYTQQIGLESAYRVVNRGPTQQRLDGTFNAVVEISGFLPPGGKGPGVEFLHYRAPATGRPTRPDVTADDLEHVRLQLQLDDVDALADALFEAQVPMLSPGVVAVDRSRYGFARGLLLKDPDGHALLLTEH